MKAGSSGLAAALVCCVCGVAWAREPAAGAGLLLPTVAAYRADESEGGSEFGDAGAWYWTILGGAAYHADSTDANLYGGLGFFLADRFEINFGVGAWLFFQEGEDTGGGNPVFGFRYHFMPKDPVDVYLDAGIGLLFTGDDVPDGGESVNFTPRAGVGTLWRLGEGANSPRLDVGLRWHHVSTASATGSDDNPSRDSVMLYVGVVFPF